jgi:hypothetical protein
MINSFDPSIVPQITAARTHQSTLFFYGHIDYEDVFRIARSSPFCFQYIPVSINGENGAQCPEHNTPEKDK